MNIMIIEPHYNLQGQKMCCELEYDNASNGLKMTYIA